MRDASPWDLIEIRSAGTATVVPCRRLESSPRDESAATRRLRDAEHARRPADPSPDAPGKTREKSFGGAARAFPTLAESPKISSEDRMNDDEPIEEPARRRRKTPQQRKAEEYANARVSSAEHPHWARVARPRRRALGHRRDRRAVAQVLRQAPSTDADALTARARAARPSRTLRPLTRPVTEKLQLARARRTLKDLAAALGQGSEPAGTEGARAILRKMLRTTRHGEMLASDLEEWIAGSRRGRGFRSPHEGEAPARLRSMLKDDPALLSRIRAWITACGILPRGMGAARVVRDDRTTKIDALLRGMIPAWPDLRDQFRAWHLKGPPAGASAILHRAKDELLAWPSWQREAGGLVGARGITYSVRLDSRGRMIVLPSALAGSLRSRTQEDARVLLGRPLLPAELTWMARFGTVGAAQAALRELGQVEASLRDAWISRRIAEWRGGLKAPRRREAPPRRPRRK